jgi:hypothetical protein
MFDVTTYSVHITAKDVPGGIEYERLTAEDMRRLFEIAWNDENTLSVTTERTTTCLECLSTSDRSGLCTVHRIAAIEAAEALDEINRR